MNAIREPSTEPAKPLKAASQSSTQQMKLYEYYMRTGFNPSGFRIKTSGEFQIHFAKRSNLLVNKLKLPHMIWRGSRVFEAGPGSGENALVLAKLGAHLTLVEPLADSLAGLKELFAHWKLQSSIDKAYLLPLEDYRPNSQFDVVIGEGFLHCLPDKKTAVRKLFGMVKPGGFLLINASDLIGVFLEYYKSFIVQLSCHLTKAAETKAKVERARLFLGEDYEKIPSARSFESWALDNIFNPFWGRDSFYNFEDMVEDLSGLDALYYSSWPSYAHPNDLKWHKHVPSPGELTRQALTGYRMRLHSFILGEVLDESQSAAELAAPASPRLLSELSKAIEAMWGNMTGGYSNLGEVRRRLTSLRRASSHKLFRSVLTEMLCALQKPDPKVYKQCRQLRRHWGCVGQYIVFRKPLELETLKRSSR